MKKSILTTLLFFTIITLFAQDEKIIKGPGKSSTGATTSNAKTTSGIKIGGAAEMPNRLRTSMNVSVGKQTISVTAIEGGAVVLLPDKTGLKIDTKERVITEMTTAEYRTSMNVTVGKQTQGATFGDRVNAGLQQAGSIVSASVSSGAMANAGSAAYAKTASEVTKIEDDEENIQLEALADGPYLFIFTINEKGAKSNFKIDFSIDKGKIISQFKGAGSPKSAGF